MAKLIRYHDLETRGIVNNRMTLGRWIRGRGFPPGFLIGDNTRVWDEADVDAWLDRQKRERTGCYDAPPAEPAAAE